MEIIKNLEDAPFISNLRTGLVEHNQGRVILLTGLPGSGKSMTAVRICEKVDPTFDLSRISIGDTVEFIKMLEAALDGKYKPGSAILGDEMGVIVPARDWNTYGNRITSQTFQIVRKLGLLIIMTTPMRRLIDVHARDMVHYYGNGRGIDYKAKRSEFKLYEIRYDDWISEPFRYNLKDGDGNPVNIWKMALPTSIDIDDYEAKKDKLLRNVLVKAREIFEGIQEQEVGGNGGNGKRFKTKDKDAVIKELVEKEGWTYEKACKLVNRSTSHYRENNIHPSDASF